jgi:hypothetical protein
MGTADYDDASTVNVTDAGLSLDESVEFHQALCCNIWHSMGQGTAGLRGR